MRLNSQIPNSTAACTEAYQAVVELFLEWLYSQQYPKDERFANMGDNRKNTLRRLKACVFGDHFLASAFRTASENAFIDSVVVAKRSPYFDAIIYAYAHLPSNSPVI